jgi:hypothetical protein
MAYLGTNGGGGLLTLGTDFVNGPASRGTPVEATGWGRVKSLYKTD